MVGNIKPKILSIILNRTVNPADLFASYDKYQFIGIFKNRCNRFIRNFVGNCKGHITVVRVCRHGKAPRAIGRADGFRLDTSESLKRIPSGFAAGSEYAELLKLKSFGIEKPIPGEVLPDTDALLEYAVGEFRRTQPFVAQLNRAVAYAYEEMR